MNKLLLMIIVLIFLKGKTFSQVNRDDALLVYEQGVDLFNQKHYVGCYQFMNMSLGYDSTYANPYVYKAWVLHLMGEGDMALSYVNKAIHIDSTLAKAYSIRATIYNAFGRMEEVFDDINKAIEIEPLNGKHYEQRSHYWEDIEIEFEVAENKSMDDLNMAIKLNPKMAVAYFNRAQLKESLGDLKGACEDWVKAKQLGFKGFDPCKECDCMDR